LHADAYIKMLSMESIFMYLIQNCLICTTRISDPHSFNADPDPAFFADPDPDPVPDPGGLMTKIEKLLQLERKLCFSEQKLQFTYL
jgi:hypothetical protein